MQKTLKYIFVALGIIIASAVLLAAVINVLVCARASFVFTDAESPDIDGKDFILVLGCGLNADGTPAKMLADRMQKAIEVYEKHGGVLLLSGDGVSSEHYDEPAAMKRIAVECGVPEEDIVTDVNGTSTAESVRRAKEIYGAESLVVITQRYHLYRAVYIAVSHGIDAVGVSADTEDYTDSFSRLAREALARIKDLFTASSR